MSSNPLVNLFLGLSAHLIGAMPPIKNVFINSRSENLTIWILFLIASVLSLMDGIGQPISQLIFPLYFVLFEGAMVILSGRRFISYSLR